LWCVCAQAQAQNPIRVPYGTPVTLGVNNANGTYTYQWYRDGRALPNETRSTLTTTLGGQYQVRAINQTNCASDLSDIFTVILMSSDLEVIKKSETRPVGPNEAFTYTITARNNGPMDDTQVVVTDNLPPGLEYVSMSSEAGSASINAGLITWRIPLLRNLDKKSLVITVKGKMPSVITNTAIITGTLPDPNQGNNTSTDEKKIVGNIKVPNVITPNGDGKNDVLKIEGIELYKENTLAIFNRWGNEVYRSVGNYQNNWSGEGLSEGTYYYVLKLISKEGVASSATGYITLLRDK
jgi:gliding motility-associated-like protein/uncharacterized repeat protein (TIGR01451 family)